MYTACKVGDVEALTEVLASLRMSDAEAGAGSKPSISIGQENVEESASKGAASDAVGDSDKSREQSTSDTKSECHERTISSNGASIETVDKQVLMEMLNEEHGQQQRTLLHLAAAGGHGPVCAVLLESGADPAVK